MPVLRILPEQVSEQWEIISHAIRETMPSYIGESERRMSNILLSIMSGDMHCWAVNNDNRTVALMLTTFTIDPAGDSAICVYALYAYENISRSVWMEIMKACRIWGESHKCNAVTFYADKERYAELLQKLNSGHVSTKQTFVSIFI